MDEANFDVIHIVAERKIKEAIEAGVFDNVPGMGEPVNLTIDPFTPAGQRLANKILGNARALPEWVQLEKDIRREQGLLGPTRDRGLAAVRAARTPASRERAAGRLRTEHVDRVRALNTMILQYCFVTPPSVQRPFVPHNVPQEAAALERAIDDACRQDSAAGNAGEQTPTTRGAKRLLRRRQ